MKDLGYVINFKNEVYKTQYVDAETYVRTDTKGSRIANEKEIEHYKRWEHCRMSNQVPLWSTDI